MCRPLRGWDSGVCDEYQTLVKAAGNEPFVCNNTDNLKERGRKLAQKCKSATYPKRTIIRNEVEEEFHRILSGRQFLITGSTRPGEREFSSVCPFTCIEPSHCSTLELFISQDPSSYSLLEELNSVYPSG